MPKAAMMTHKNLVTTIASLVNTDIHPCIDDVHMSYLPLPHIMEKLVVAVLTAVGGRFCIYRGDLTKIKDDLSIIKPTFFIGVPRVFNKFYVALKRGIEQL